MAAVRTAGPDVDIGDNFEVPSRVSVESYDVGGLSVDLVAEYRADAGRYEARELTVRSADRELTGAALRSVPVARIVHDAVLAAITPLTPPTRTFTPPPGAESPGPERDAWLQQNVRTPWPDRDLEHAARVYRLALLVGDAPTQAVAKELGIPRSTAGRWVTRARDRGLLTVQDPRGSRKG